VFPLGFAHRLEPHPGFSGDLTALGAGGLCFAALLLAWTAVAVVIPPRRRPRRQTSTFVEAVATRCPTGAQAVGVRFALVRSIGDRGSVAAAVAGVSATIALMTGAVVFGSSVTRLVSDGRLYGRTFDLQVGAGGDQLSPELRDAVGRDRDVAGLTYYATTEARVGGHSVGVAGMKPVRGDVTPPALRGRLPASADEVALGRLVARTVGVGVGDHVRLGGPAGNASFRVTGIAVMPGVSGLNGIGQDGLVTMEGLSRLDPDAQVNSAVVALRKGAGPDAARRFGMTDEGELPAVIRNVARIRAVPYLLAWVVGALAVLTIAHLMITSVRNRRRDLAVLRAVGAHQSWVTRVVHWQATAFGVVALLIGVPLGLVAGRTVYRAFADSIGAVPEPSLPYLRLVGVAVGLMLIANLATVVPARRARRLAPGRLLADQ
jgi:ABC-type lipoprotein release transport system permease subunit